MIQYTFKCNDEDMKAFQQILYLDNKKINHFFIFLFALLSICVFGLSIGYLMKSDYKNFSVFLLISLGLLFEVVYYIWTNIFLLKRELSEQLFHSLKYKYLKDSEGTYIFSEEGIEFESDVYRAHYSWESIVKKGTLKTYLYLKAENGHYILINQERLGDRKRIELEKMLNIISNIDTGTSVFSQPSQDKELLNGGIQYSIINDPEEKNIRSEILMENNMLLHSLRRRRKYFICFCILINLLLLLFFMIERPFVMFLLAVPLLDCVYIKQIIFFVPSIIDKSVSYAVENNPVLYYYICKTGIYVQCRNCYAHYPWNTVSEYEKIDCFIYLKGSIDVIINRNRLSEIDHKVLDSLLIDHIHC